MKVTIQTKTQTYNAIAPDFDRGFLEARKALGLPAGCVVELESDMLSGDVLHNGARVGRVRVER